MEEEKKKYMYITKGTREKEKKIIWIEWNGKKRKKKIKVAPEV